MSAVVASGTQTCIPATNHVLLDSTVAGSFVLVLDCAALTGTDVLNVQLLRKVLSTSTLRKIVDQNILGADIDAGEEPIFQSIPIASPGFEYTAQVKLTVGAVNRNIGFSVETV